MGDYHREAINDAVLLERRNMLLATQEAMDDANNGVCTHEVALRSLLDVIRSMHELGQPKHHNT